jgi:hypothetical protein
MNKIALLSFVIILFVFTCSCKSKEPNKNESLSITEKEHLKNENTDNGFENEEFEDFWKRFRNDIINSDYANLQRKVILSFTVKGFQDIDPILELKEEDFKYVFNLFLNEHLIFDEELDTHLKFIKHYENIYEVTRPRLIVYENQDFVRVEYIEFEKVDSEWKLTRIYMDTRGLEEKIKEHRENINN